MNYSRGAKKRARRGRRLIPNVERLPDGRISRSNSAKEGRQKATVAETLSVALEARMRVYGASEAECGRPEMGHALGRLYLDKRNGISAEMFQAGIRMAEEYSRYYGLTGVPFPSPRAQDLFRVGGIGGDVDPAKARKARNDAQAIELVLAIGDEAGCPVRTITKRVCIEDSDEGLYRTHMINYLRRGLKLLVVHYGIEAGRKAA